MKVRLNESDIRRLEDAKVALERIFEDLKGSNELELEKLKDRLTYISCKLSIVKKWVDAYEREYRRKEEGK